MSEWALASHVQRGGGGDGENMLPWGHLSRCDADLKIQKSMNED